MTGIGDRKPALAVMVIGILAATTCLCGPGVSLIGMGSAAVLVGLALQRGLLTVEKGTIPLFSAFALVLVLTLLHAALDAGLLWEGARRWARVTSVSHSSGRGSGLPRATVQFVSEGKSEELTAEWLFGTRPDVGDSVAVAWPAGAPDRAQVVEPEALFSSEVVIATFALAALSIGLFAGAGRGR